MTSRCNFHIGVQVLLTTCLYLDFYFIAIVYRYDTTEIVALSLLTTLLLNTSFTKNISSCPFNINFIFTNFTIRKLYVKIVVD